MSLLKIKEIRYKSPTGECPITSRAKLDQSQFNRIISDSEPDEILARLEYRGETTRLPAPQRHALLSSALSLARERKIDGDDTILWCAACLIMNTTNDLAALRGYFATWITDNMRTNDDDSPVTA